MTKKVADNSSIFVWGFVIGYIVRHIFPPKETQTWEWIVAGILILIALGIWIWANVPTKKNNKKPE